jgi:hypothetical protein
MYIYRIEIVKERKVIDRDHISPMITYKIFSIAMNIHKGGHPN